MTDTLRKQAAQRERARVRLALSLACLAIVAAGCSGKSRHKSHPSPVQVASIAPATGPFIGGQPVTIVGDNFTLDGATTAIVHIGGQPCSNVVVVDDNTITCVTPAGTPGLQADVDVTIPAGSGELDDGYRFFDAIRVRSDVNGDGIADLIVSAPLLAEAGAGAGGVLVFFGSSDSAELVDRGADLADVRVTGEGAGDGFGGAVCAGDVDGDGQDDLVVGAALADNGAAADSGKVYVFRGPLAAGVLSAASAQVVLRGELTQPGGRFGETLDLGDADMDGTLDVCVAAPRHDSGNPALDPTTLDRGCVYVVRGGASLGTRGAEAADYTLGGASRNDRLGASVAFGDFDGDGTPEMALGCPSADPMNPVLQQDAGAVYVLRCGGSLVSGAVATSSLLIAGELAGDAFGSVVAAGDVDGDGITDLLVTAPRNDYYEVDGGRVYVFKGGAGFAPTIAQGASIKLSGMATHDSFGTSLRVTDLDGDNVSDLLIGAPLADALNEDNGRAYVFHGRASLADDVAVGADLIIAGENSADDQLGRAVSVVDFDGDHIADVVVGSARNAYGAGRVYLFRAGAAGQRGAVSADVAISGVQTEGLLGQAIAEGQ